MITTLKSRLNAILDIAKSPVLCWSSGDDSTLLLAVLKDVDRPFDIWQRRDLWTREQKKRADSLIKKWDLRVFNYAPSTISLIGQDDEISIVEEYVVGTAKIAAVTDVVEGTRCIAELGCKTMNWTPLKWSDHIVGTRQQDRHYAFGDGTLAPSESWQQGDVNFHAPLYDWTTEDVRSALNDYGIEPKTTEEGDAEFCSKCLHSETFCPLEQRMIPKVAWSPTENLDRFRMAYSVQ